MTFESETELLFLHLENTHAALLQTKPLQLICFRKKIVTVKYHFWEERNDQVLVLKCLLLKQFKLHDVFTLGPQLIYKSISVLLTAFFPTINFVTYLLLCLFLKQLCVSSLNREQQLLVQPFCSDCFAFHSLWHQSDTRLDCFLSVLLPNWVSMMLPAKTYQPVWRVIQFS